MTQTTTVTSGSIPASAKVILSPRTAPSAGATLRPFTYTAAQNGVTAGGNGTGAIQLTVCNASGSNATPSAITIDFVALD